MNLILMQQILAVIITVTQHCTLINFNKITAITAGAAY